MASVKLILYKHKTLKDGSFPIIIQVIKNRKRKTFSTGFSSTPELWNENLNLPNKKHPHYHLLTQLLRRKILEVEQIMLQLENSDVKYNLKRLESEIKGEAPVHLKFNDYVQSIVNNLVKLNKIGNSKAYKNTQGVFTRFAGKDFLLKDIDQQVVKNFEADLITRGGTTNGISFQLRTLRAIINRAIKEGLVNEADYAYKNFQIKSCKTRKRAVNKDVIKKIEDLNVSTHEDLQFYKDLFLFSFYNRGMNFVDIAFLQVKNIQDGRINYVRRKTGQQFSVKVSDKVNAIIARYNDLKHPDTYIFPIIYRKENQYLDYRNSMRLMNKKLKKISGLLMLDIPLTTYVTRHSWATIAKRSGISTAVISEGLGHTTEEITQVYLDSFENEVLDNANDQIIN